MVNELEETQWAYLLSPEFELINTAGKPLTNGWIEVYIHGTRTKYYCASDFTGTLHPFKIPLDSLGANIVLASPANSYDVYVYNKFGNLVMSRYNVLPQVAGTAVVSGGVVLDSSDGTITIEQSGDNTYNLSIADIINSVTANIDESITNIEGDITEINQDITEITQVVTGLPTHADVYDSIVTGIDYTINTVTGLIPEAQVQSDWDESNPTDPAYILNKPDLDNYVTIDELTEVISGVTGFNLEMGQFYCQTTTGGAVMGRTKGNIEVTNDGKIKLKQGKSYHVTVRGGYSKATASADYGVLSYIEYITGQNINVNVDNSVTDTQYFEISYDIYKLSSDKNYYVFFSLPTGSSVNNLFIEIHSIGCMGTGGSGSGVPVEYDAGWGINIIDNVISVDPSILNQYVTQEELVSAVSGLAPEYTAGDNIVIDNDTISLSDVVTIQAREGETSSGSIAFGNIVHWGQQDYGPGWTIEAYTDQGRGYHSYNTCDIGLQSFFWGDYDHDRANNSVSGQSTITISEGDIKYQQGEFQSTDTLPVIWSCSQMARDISELQGAITAVTGVSADNIVDYDDADLFDKVEAIYNDGRSPIVRYTYNSTPGQGFPYSKETYFTEFFRYSEDNEHGHTNGYRFNYERHTGNYLENELIHFNSDGVKERTLQFKSLEIEAGAGISVASGYDASTVISINPAEVATAISGLIPVGTGNNILDVSDYTAAELYTKIGEMLTDGMSPVIKSGSNYYNYVEHGNNTYEFNHMWNVEDGQLLNSLYYMKLSVSSTAIDEYGSDVSYYAGNYVNIDPSSRQISVSPSITGLMTDVASGMIPEQEAVEFLELVAGANITLTESATGIVISSTGGGGSSYTAGNGIDITNDVISVDNTVAMKTDIPDVSDFVTEQEVSGMIPEQEAVEFLELTAGDNISIASGVISVTGMPDITGLATKEEVQDGLELVTGLIPNYTAGDNIDITNNVISVSGTEDLTLMNLTAGEGISITPDVSGNVEIACTSTGVTKTLLYTGSSTDSRSGTFTLSQSGYNFDRLEMTLIDVDNYVIKQVCEMPADNLVGVNGTRGSSFNSITSGTQTWFKAMNWQLNSAGTTLTYWVDEIATSGSSITAINRDQTSNRPIMLRIYGIKE